MLQPLALVAELQTTARSPAPGPCWHRRSLLPPTLCPPPAHPLPFPSPSVLPCLALPCASESSCLHHGGHDEENLFTSDCCRPVGPSRDASASPPRWESPRFSAVPGYLCTPAATLTGRGFLSWQLESGWQKSILTVRDAVNYSQGKTVQAPLKPAGRSLSSPWL